MTQSVKFDPYQYIEAVSNTSTMLQFEELQKLLSADDAYTKLAENVWQKVDTERFQKSLDASATYTELATDAWKTVDTERLKKLLDMSAISTELAEKARQRIETIMRTHSAIPPTSQTKRLRDESQRLSPAYVSVAMPQRIIADNETFIVATPRMQAADSSDTTVDQPISTDKSPPSYNGLFSDSRLSMDKYKRFIELLQHDIFEPDLFCESESYFLSLYKEDKLLSFLYLRRARTDYLSDEHFAEGILHILSGMDCEEIYPDGFDLVLSLASSRAPVIQELVVRCLEHWGGSYSVRILKESIVPVNAAIGGYIDRVIRDLEG